MDHIQTGLDLIQLVRRIGQLVLDVTSNFSSILNLIHQVCHLFMKLRNLITEFSHTSKRPFRRGCSTCILNLVRDLGIPYFEQKSEETQKTPVSASSPAKGRKGPGKGKTSQKPKNSK